MGRGIHKSSINAIAIYLVEPKYFDDHKKKVTSKVGKQKQGRRSQGRSSQKKAKTSQLTVNQNNAVTDSEGDDDNDNNGNDGDGGVNQMDVNNELIRGADSTRATAVNSNVRTEVQQNTPIIAAQLIPPPAGMTEDKYKFQVMDTYINAKARGICQQKVCDEYFGNDKGQRCMLSTYFRDL